MFGAETDEHILVFVLFSKILSFFCVICLFECSRVDALSHSGLYEANVRAHKWSS